MIRRLTAPYQFSQDELNCIALANNDWDSQRNCIEELKRNMNIHFDNEQGEKCCYCGLQYDRTGRGEIEHIAPKGQTLHPSFSYAPNNLAKACQLCNSSSMKHHYDSIQILHPNYEQCVFSIVHPYLDDPSQHYGWSHGLLRVLISVINNSAKGQESIRLFQLDSVRRTRARAEQRNQERVTALFQVTDAITERVRRAMRFRR